MAHAHDDGDEEDLDEEEVQEAIRKEEEANEAEQEEEVESPAAAVEVVEEAEGLKLHLSAGTTRASRWTRASVRRQGRFRAG